MNNNIDALIFAFVVTFYSFSTCVFFDFIPPDLPPTCHSDRRSFRSWILRLRTFCPEKVCPERSLFLEYTKSPFFERSIAVLSRSQEDYN